MANHTPGTCDPLCGPCETRLKVRAAIIPTRADHCTHPNQDWCDCDWCRINQHWVKRP